jgi:hypothetical protein
LYRKTPKNNPKQIKITQTKLNQELQHFLTVSFRKKSTFGFLWLKMAFCGTKSNFKSNEKKYSVSLYRCITFTKPDTGQCIAVSLYQT